MASKRMKSCLLLLLKPGEFREGWMDGEERGEGNDAYLRG